MRKPGDTARRWLAPLVGAASLSGLALALTAAALGAGTATAPLAITGPVTAVGPQTATLSGTVNPNGVSTSWQFQYGKTTTYGSSTTVMDAGTGTVNTGVSASLTGLAAATTYHYRLVATSSGGVTDGADGIFTTAATSSALPSATTGPATAIGATGATLTGSVTPNGQATTYSFQYGETTSYGSQTSPVSSGSGTTPIAVSATIAGLKEGQSYHYRLVASSSAGTSDGADLTFTPVAAPGRPDGDHEAGELGRADGGEAEREHRPERTGDELLLRIRHLDELQREDGGRERRRGNEGRCRRGHPQRPRRRRLPLPARRDERGRHRRGRRPHLRERRSAGRPDRLGRGRLDERGDADRHRQPRRQRDELVLPVRHHLRLRAGDAEPERGLGRRRHRGLRHDRQARGRDDLPLPPRRHERRRHERRR